MKTWHGLQPWQSTSTVDIGKKVRNEGILNLNCKSKCVFVLMYSKFDNSKFSVSEAIGAHEIATTTNSKFT